MSKEDQAFFGFDVWAFCMYDNCREYTLGLRTHVMKESLNNLDVARKKFLMQRFAHYVILMLYYSVVMGYFFHQLLQISHFTDIRQFYYAILFCLPYLYIFIGWFQKYFYVQNISLTNKCNKTLNTDVIRYVA